MSYSPHATKRLGKTPWPRWRRPGAKLDTSLPTYRIGNRRGRCLVGSHPVTPILGLGKAVRFHSKVLGVAVRSADGRNVSVPFGKANSMFEGPADFYSETYNAAIRGRLGLAGPVVLYIGAEDL